MLPVASRDTPRLSAFGVLKKQVNYDCDSQILVQRLVLLHEPRDFRCTPLLIFGPLRRGGGRQVVMMALKTARVVPGVLGSYICIMTQIASVA